MTKQITFGISFRGKPSYTQGEVWQFIENATSIGNSSLEARYVDFLERFLSGKINKSTHVDLDVIETFQRDIDNRADIDYREDHWDHEPVISAGGKYFDSISKKLKAHISQQQ